MTRVAARKRAFAPLRAMICASALVLASSISVRAAEPLELKGFSLRAQAPNCEGGWWDHGGLALCSITNQTLLGKPIKSLSLTAYRGRVVGVTAYVSDERHAMEVKAALVEKFGLPQNPSERVWLWERGADRLVMVFNFEAMAWTIALVDMTVDERLKRDRQDQQAPTAKGRKQDL